MANNAKPRRAPGSQQPFVNLNPQYQIANQAPTIYDNYEPSTIWIQQVDTSGNPVNEIWIMSSTQNGAANWIQVAQQGGAGFFTSLVVEPGPITLNGLTEINEVGDADTYIGNVAGGSVTIIGVGLSLDSAAGSFIDIGAAQITTGTIIMGSSLTTGTISIGGTAGTGLITVGDSTGNQTLDLGVGTGNSTVNIATNATGVNAVTIGGTNASSAVTIRAGTTGGISLNSGGNVGVVSSTATAASPVATITKNNFEIITATFTGFTTASAATQAFTIDSNLILATSGLHVTLTNLNISGNGAEMTITNITQAVGSIVVNTVNSGAGALGAGDNVLISVWIMG
jgi:hypothetical protein